MNAARFREYARIQRPVRERNAIGEETVTAWALIGDVWMELVRGQAREIAAGDVGPDANRDERRVRMRWPVDLGAGDRILWNDATYGVEGVELWPATGELFATLAAIDGDDGR